MHDKRTLTRLPLSLSVLCVFACVEWRRLVVLCGGSGVGFRSVIVFACH